MEGDLTWGGEHTVQCTENVLQNCTPETYIISLINVTPINLIKKTWGGRGSLSERGWEEGGVMQAGSCGMPLALKS